MTDGTFTSPTVKTIATVSGLALILVGLVFNEWTAALAFSDDNYLKLSTRIAIWGLEILAVGFGVALLAVRDKPTLATNILLSLATLVVSLVVGDLALRIEFPQERLGIFMENPSGAGSYRLKPDLEIDIEVDGRNVKFRTNSLGMAWREISRTKQPGITRVAFVGDSFTMGQWADDFSHSFVGVFDHLHNDDIEVLNFGVAGYGFSDVELLLEEEVLSFSPDYVILAEFNGNDFLDTYLGIERYELVEALDVDPDVLLEKVPVEFIESAQPESGLAGGIRGYLFRSPLATLIFGNWRSVLPRYSVDFQAGRYINNTTFWSRTEYPPFAVAAADTSLKVLQKIHSLVEGTDADLAIVAIPTIQQVYAEIPVAEDYDIALPQQLIKDFSANLSISYLDLLPEMRRQAPTSELYVRGDGHFNNEGHRLAGEVISAFFDQIVVDGKRYTDR